MTTASCLLIWMGCNNDSSHQAVDQNLLTGRWELQSALRNGKPTETLTGTFYEFSPEGLMRTNLTPSGIEEEFHFQLSGNELKQKGEEEEISYQIEALTDSALVMSMEMRDLPFKITLHKVPPLQIEAVEEIIE